VTTQHIRPATPRVVDGETLEVVEYRPTDGHPLAGTRLAWAGLLTDAEIQQIAARVAYGRLPWWLRWFTTTPSGWVR
jgi:hypothetical protein